MNNIYVIVYSDYVDCAFPQKRYFTDKNKAIKHLEEKGYTHIRDDEYEGYDLEAVIWKLEKGE